MKVTTQSNNDHIAHEHRTVTFGETVRSWVRLALLSFGGPADQIAVMHRILVDEKKWISEERFLHALNYRMLLPGPEAQQLATYIGWLLHRTPGGLVAGILFILPGFASILVLSIISLCIGSDVFKVPVGDLEIESSWQLIPLVAIGRTAWIYDEGRLDVLNSATSMAVRPPCSRSGTARCLLCE